MAEPVFFETEAEFRRWLQANYLTAPELLVAFWKKDSGKPSIDWPQSRDQALCFGWIDGARKSLGDGAYTIRFTPRRKGSIWSKVNCERFAALKAAGLMMSEGERAFEENRHKSGIYAYERPLTDLTPAEVELIRADAKAWTDWEKRPPGYRKTILYWITSAKWPETRAKRLTQLIAASADRRSLR